MKSNLSKIERLLGAFLTKENQNRPKLDNLLSLLDRQEQEGIESALMTLPLFTKWIERAVTTWSTTGAKPGTDVVSFALNLASLLSRDEQRFCKLNEDSFFVKLITVLDVRKRDKDSCVLAYIKLLASFIEHKSGLDWMVAHDFWEDVFKLGLSDQDDIIFAESVNFVAKFLDKVQYNEAVCGKLIKTLVSPLAPFISESNRSQEVSRDDVESSAKFLANVLEHFLFRGKDFRAVYLVLKSFYQETRVALFTKIDTSFYGFHFCRIILIAQFLELHVRATSRAVNRYVIDSEVDKIKKNFISTISSGNFGDVIEYINFGIFYWYLMESKVRRSSVNTFSSQLIVLLLVPGFSVVIKHCPKPDNLDEVFDEFRNTHITNMVNTTCPEITRVCYQWRDSLAHHPNVFQFALQSINYLKESRRYFSKSDAIVVFQAMIYSLKDFIRAFRPFPETIEIFASQHQYFFEMFELIGLLFHDFTITWSDVYETIHVLPTTFDFLTLAECPKDLSLQIFKVIYVTIEKSDAPNLTLVIDGTPNLFGPLLHAKACGGDSEVRNAVVEVVYIVAHMTNIKFPSLQKVLMDSELPTLVVKMSTCDGESFVRATAIKCLQEMIQVEEIWNNALKSEDLCQKMRDILLNETEGIVRVEAATFMCVAYEHQQFPKDTLDRIYETMIYSSTTDLHWEVKVRALGFWDKVIKNHLQNQGMIDGSFPNVTFSKEHRKIVTLTDSEIRKRLLKVLGQLSSIGCLGVLMSAIKDDCDMEVSKTAVKITQRLVDLFRKYNLRNDCSAPTSPLPTENGMSTTMSMSSGVSVDESMDSPASSHPDLNEEIIEQIVNSKDVSLLKNVYAPSDYGSVSNYDIQVRKIVTPNEFLQFTQQDLNNIIAEKKKWLNGIEDLGSLLDDMLKTYDDDVNNMDCY